MEENAIQTLPLEYRLLDRLRGIKKRTWIAVLTALAVGILTHAAAMTGIMINSDSGFPVMSYQWFVGHGRFSLGILGELRGHVGMGTVTVPICILCLGATAGITVSILDIRSGILAGILGGMEAAFPTVVSILSYPFVADMQLFALLLAALGAYCTIKYKRGWIAAPLLIAFSMGAYQAQISFAASLLLVYCLLQLFSPEVTFRQVLLQGLKYIGVLAASVGVYYLLVKLTVAVTGYALVDYVGISNMDVINWKAVLHAVTGSYWKVSKFFLLDRYGVTNSSLGCWLYRFALLLTAGLYFAAVIRAKLAKSPAKLVLSLVLTALIPLGISLVAVFWQNPELNWLQMYAYVMVFALMLKLADLLPDFQSIPDNPKQKRRAFGRTAARLGTVLVGAMLVFHWYSVSTQCYSKMRLGYEAAVTECTMIAGDLVDLPGFTEETPVALMGTASYRDYDAQFYYLANFDTIAGKSMIGDSNMIKRLLSNYLQVYFTYADGAETDAVMNTETYQSMPCWPDHGYVQMIDGVAVIKLSP